MDKNNFNLDDLDNLDATFNNLEVGCITSKNKTFSLDEDGNLVVNTITTNSGSSGSDINIQTLTELLFPVGFICSFSSDFNPNGTYAGKWEQLKDVFLLGAGSNYALGETGGNLTHTHASAAHSHTSAGHSHNYGSLYTALNMAGSGGIYYLTKTGVGFSANERKNDTGIGQTQSTYRNEGMQVLGDTGFTTPSDTGLTTPSNTGSASNVPPYKAVNFWQRIE